MARGGITKTDIEQARIAILARGEHASIDAVRVELGNTGSRSTIHRYMRALEDSEVQSLAGEERQTIGTIDMEAVFASLQRGQLPGLCWHSKIPRVPA